MIDQAIARYLTHLKYDQGGAKNTIIAYRTDLLQFKQVLKRNFSEELRSQALQASHLNPYLVWLKDQEYKPATIARKMAALRSFVSYLHDQEGLDLDGHLRKLELPKDQRHKPQALSPPQIRQLLSAPAASTSARDIRDSAILAFLYATGLRAADAVQVKVDDLDLERGVLDRRQAETDPLPLGTARQPVQRYVVEGRPQLLRNRGESTLFLNQRGTGLTRQGLWLVVKRWAKACNLPPDVSPYTLRHSLTQHLLNSGLPRQEVQHRLGLSSANAIRYHLSAQG